ncbi:MAG: hypothetical protein M0P69_12720 [Bacteroidales bacterium]|nr:hypothetical protein [Bacteroidales bacterium]
MKQLLIITGVFVIAALFYHQQRQIQSYKDTAQLQSVELSTLKDSVKVIHQKNGALSYQVKAVEVEKRNLRESLEIAGYEIKDLKEKEIRWRKITSTLRAELESKGTGQTEIIKTEIVTETDTIIQGNFAWNNKYLFLDGKINENLISFDYRYNTPINIFTSEKKKETIVTVSLADPNASIISANSITISKKRKWYQKPWVWGAAGLATGIIVAK